MVSVTSPSSAAAPPTANTKRTCSRRWAEPLPVVRGLQELGQGVGHGGRDRSDVGDDLAAADQPETHGVDVAQHRDVEPGPGQQRTEGEEADEARPGAVERERRPGDVRGDQVDDRSMPAFEEPLVQSYAA